MQESRVSVAGRHTGGPAWPQSHGSYAIVWPPPIKCEWGMWLASKQ